MRLARGSGTGGTGTHGVRAGGPDGVSGEAGGGYSYPDSEDEEELRNFRDDATADLADLPALLGN